MNFGLEGTEAAVVPYGRNPEEMEAVHLQPTLEEKKAAVKRQELRDEGVRLDTIGSLEDRYVHRQLAVLFRRRLRKRARK
jgi:hypothetical protein